MHPARFEPPIPASERPQIHALDRTAIWVGGNSLYRYVCNEPVT